MSITTDENLSVHPPSTTLPAQVILHQVLSTTKRSEKVNVSYSIVGNAVCFDDGTQLKTFAGVVVVKTSTVLDHAVALRWRVPPGATQGVQIDQLITSVADGDTTTDHVGLTVVAGQ